MSADRVARAAMIRETFGKSSFDFFWMPDIGDYIEEALWVALVGATTQGLGPEEAVKAFVKTLGDRFEKEYDHLRP